MVAGLLPQKLEVDRGLTHVSDEELLAIIRGGGEEAPVVSGGRQMEVARVPGPFCPRVEAALAAPSAQAVAE